MSDTSVTVKDLANELHVQPRDMLRVLHTLNISAKTLMSDVSVDNVPRVREYLANASGEWQESRSGSDVVVRRRRRSPSEDSEKKSESIHKAPKEATQEKKISEEPQEPSKSEAKDAVKKAVEQTSPKASSADASKKVGSEPVAEKVVASVDAKKVEQAPSESKQAQKNEAPQSVQEKVEQAQPEKNRSEQAKPKQNKAGQNRQEQPRSEQNKAERGKSGQQRSEQAKSERNKSGQARADQPRSEQGKSGQAKATDTSRNAERASGANGNKSEDAPKKRKSSRKKSERPIINVAAKVISRPTDKIDTPAAAPQPAVETQSVAVPTTPVEPQEPQSLKKPEEPVVVAPVQSVVEQPVVEQTTPNTAEQNTRAEKKSPEGKIEGKDAGSSKQAKRSATAHVAPKIISRPNDNRVRPDASASPDLESSAPSLLPPVEVKNRDTGAQPSEERRSRRSEAPSTPQVRIISRPDATSVSSRKNETSSRDGAKQGRDGSRGDSSNSRDGRNNNDRRDRRNNRDNRDGRDGARSEGRDNRDGRDRDNRDRDGRNTNRDGRNSRPASRPSGTPRSGGMRPDMGMPLDGMLDGREGQSKKKRNKNQNRRGNDFMQMDDESMNFSGRRHEMDDDTDMPRIRGKKRPSKNRDARSNQPSTQPVKAAKRKIKIEEGIRVADLAHQMGIKSGEIIKVLFGLGIMATINQTLDLDTASVVASEFGYEVEKTGFVETDYLAESEADTPESLKRRPPVVTIMGHVDHGKTSLLDAIRKTHVTSGEAGGITQHIGAYYVKTKNGDIAFLDTPGHEAFTAMRARGAQITDLVVLVVAADDGVMEQTREAINHSRAAGVPIMVAVNKIDKPTANPERVLRELAEMGLVAEEWGGDTVVAKVSAKTHEGLDEMLELLALQAEILDLKANPDKPARGHIVEAKLDKGRGPVATVLIQEGTLHQGDNFVCGVFSGRVRAMFNDQGRKVKEAGPSHPVEVQGFEGVPEAGEPFICLADEKVARRIAEARAMKQREHDLVKQNKVTLETFLAQPADAEEARVLNLVVKADVQGSLEAIIEALNKQSTEKVKINVIHGGTGAITESDILLASASQAIVIGFNVRPTAKVKAFAEQENIDIRFYDIIYKLVDEIKSAMAGLLAPVSKEVYLGQAEVRQVYSIPKVGNIAGCFVSDGKLTRSAGIRLLRDGVVVHTGKLASLKRFKDDAREVLKGFECGVNIENFNDVKVGDILDAFEIVTEAAQL